MDLEIEIHGCGSPHQGTRSDEIKSHPVYDNFKHSSKAKNNSSNVSNNIHV